MNTEPMIKIHTTDNGNIASKLLNDLVDHFPKSKIDALNKVYIGGATLHITTPDVKALKQAIQDHNHGPNSHYDLLVAYISTEAMTDEVHEALELKDCTGICNNGTYVFLNNTLIFD